MAGDLPAVCPHLRQGVRQGEHRQGFLSQIPRDPDVIDRRGLLAPVAGTPLTLHPPGREGHGPEGKEYIPGRDPGGIDGQAVGKGPLFLKGDPLGVSFVKPVRSEFLEPGPGKIKARRGLARNPEDAHQDTTVLTDPARARELHLLAETGTGTVYKPLFEDRGRGSRKQEEKHEADDHDPDQDLRPAQSGTPHLCGILPEGEPVQGIQRHGDLHGQKRDADQEGRTGGKDRGHDALAKSDADDLEDLPKGLLHQ